MRLQSLGLVIFSCLAAAPALAVEDHAVVAGRFNWIPSPETLSAYPEVGPYRDHYLQEVTFDKDEDTGLFTMRIRLPEDLSGGETTYVTLTEASHDDATGDWTFGNPEQGYLYCGFGDSWSDGGCDVKLKPLPLDSATLGAYTKNKYRGTDREQAMQSVAERLAPEPIGTMGFTTPDQVLDGGLQGLGKWDTQYQKPDGTWVTAKMTIDFDRGVYDPGGPMAGRIGGLIYDGATADGGWSFGDAYGWVKFTFEGDSFTGTWGDYDHDGPLGQWTGVRSVD